MLAAQPRRSCALIVNPGARRSTVSRRIVVQRALEAHMQVEVAETSGPGSGMRAAREAVARGHDLVVAYGGDGIVNETANGLVDTGASLGIIPGGTMDVFARSLGIPRAGEDAVAFLASRLDDPPRRLSMGAMDGRYFTFAAGCGFDAEAAELVESHQASKRRFGEAYFYWSALKVLAGSHRHRRASIKIDLGDDELDVAMAVVCNAGPYAYLFGRAVRLAPEVDIDAALDLFALRSMKIEALPWYTFRAAVTGDLTSHRDAVYVRDRKVMTLTAERPFKRHVDGEPLPPASTTQVTWHPEALRVIA